MLNLPWYQLASMGTVAIGAAGLGGLDSNLCSKYGCQTVKSALLA